MGNRRIERAFGGIGGIEMLYKFVYLSVSLIK